MRLPLKAMLTLAWRNLWRNYRRTGIMLAAIAVGVWAMVFMTALMRGMVDEMVKDGIRSLPGYVQIHDPAYRDDPSISNSLLPPDGELLAALEAPEVAAWTARLKVPAVISSERESRGVTLLGVEPVGEQLLSFDAEDIVEGRFLEDAEDRGLVIGAKLARRLDTKLGKRVVIMSQDPENEIADRGFRVVGIYKAKLESMEETYAYAGRSTLQELLRVGDQVSEIAVLGHDYRDVEDLYRHIEAAAGSDREVLPWQELDTYLSSMMGMMDGFVLVWIIVVFLALSFGLVNTMVMAVFERVREIGLMMALGMRPATILYQILVESFFLLAIGLGLGNVLAVASIKPLEGGLDLSVVAEGMAMMGASSTLYPALQARDMVLASAIVIALGMLTSLLPAWRASRLDPVVAINKT